MKLYSLVLYSSFSNVGSLLLEIISGSVIVDGARVLLVWLYTASKTIGKLQQLSSSSIVIIAEKDKIGTDVSITGTGDAIVIDVSWAYYMNDMLLLLYLYKMEEESYPSIAFF